MKKSTEAAVNEYVSLIGGKTWELITRHCTGKWRGTIDYSILIDNHIKLFISNGMANFEKQIVKNLTKFKQFEQNKKYYLGLLQKQAEIDNALAKSKNINTVKLIDIGQISFEATDNYFFDKAYILIEVNGKQFKHYTTNLNIALKENDLEDYLASRNNNKLYVAASVIIPDYILCNVAFSSTDNNYKIK